MPSRSLLTIALWWLLVSIAGPHPSNAQGQSIGEIVVAGTEQSVSVAVEVADPVLLRRAQANLQLHGSLRLSEAAQAAYRVAIREIPGGIQVSLRDRQGALLRSSDLRSPSIAGACDQIVEWLFGTPGFFDSRLAFVSDRSGDLEIYLSDLLFERPQQLTRDRSECVAPALAPDGSAVLYTSYFRNGFPDIYRIDLQTYQRTVFAAFKGVNTGAAFDPSGSRVALILSGEGNAELFVTLDGSQDFRRLTRNRGLEADPAWSPDGRQIAFTSDAAGRPQIFTILAEGGEARRLRTGLSATSAEPAWNPRDDRQVVFSVLQGGVYQLALYDAREGRSVLLTQGAADSIEAHWLRDGRHLIFTRRVPNRSQLMLLDVATGREIPLSPPDMGNCREVSVAYP